MRLLQIGTAENLLASHAKWVEAKLGQDSSDRSPEWTESIASGSKSFLETIKKKLGYRARGRSTLEASRSGIHQLREPESHYGDNVERDTDNLHPWNP